MKSGRSRMPVSPPSPDLAVRLVPLQQMASGGRWRTEAMRSYRMPVLLWFTRGQGRITLAGTARGYGAHNAIYVPPRVMHGFGAASQIFGTAIFFNTSNGLHFPNEALHLRIRDAAAQTEMTGLLEQMTREILYPKPSQDHAIHHLAGLMTVWLDRQIKATDAPLDTATASQHLAARFTELVERQLYTGQSLEEYAEALDVSLAELTQVCTETCGRSPADILQDRVTYEARRLLADTPLPIKRVAEILGFDSPTAFNQTFKSSTGLLPGEFRASVATQAGPSSAA